MIDLICPGYEKHIEDDFPQVPEQNQGKSRIAFVLFKTHQAAHDVKGELFVLSNASQLGICFVKYYLNVILNRFLHQTAVKKSFFDFIK